MPTGTVAATPTRPRLSIALPSRCAAAPTNSSQRSRRARSRARYWRAFTYLRQTKGAFNTFRLSWQTERPPLLCAPHHDAMRMRLWLWRPPPTRSAADGARVSRLGAGGRCCGRWALCTCLRARCAPIRPRRSTPSDQRMIAALHRMLRFTAAAGVLHPPLSMHAPLPFSRARCARACQRVCTLTRPDERAPHEGGKTK